MLRAGPPVAARGAAHAAQSASRQQGRQFNMAAWASQGVPQSAAAGSSGSRGGTSRGGGRGGGTARGGSSAGAKRKANSYMHNCTAIDPNRPIPPDESLTFELHRLEIHQLERRLYIVRRVHGRSKPGAVNLCARVFRALDQLDGVVLTGLSLHSSWDEEDTWSFPPQLHNRVLQLLEPDAEGKGGVRVPIEPVPRHVLGLLARTIKPLPSNDEIERAIGPKLTRKLLPFQLDGLRFGIRRDGKCILGDDMGLGKTLQGIALAIYFAVVNQAFPIAIVVPSSLRQHWGNEAKKNMRGVCLPDDDEQLAKCVRILFKGKDSLGEVGETKVLVTSYGLLSSQGMPERMHAHKFKTVILDESQYVKTLKSKRSVQALALCKRARHRFLLSGTPMDKTQEMYAQVRAVDPTVFPAFWATKNQWDPSKFFYSVRYCDPKKERRKGNTWGYVHTGSDREQEINAILTHLMLIRRLKADVLPDLPPKIRERVIIDEYTGRKLATFKKKLEELKDIRDDDGSLASNPEFLELVRQTVRDKVAPAVRYFKELVWPFLEDNPTEKIIIFTYHYSMRDSIAEELEKADIGYMRIDGKVDPKLRQGLVDDFQTKPHVRVALLSITAAGCGLTLTAANTVYFAELDFSPANIFQAEDRAHRIGQLKPVLIRFLFVKGSTDERQWRMLQRKASTAGSVLDNSSVKIGANVVVYTPDDAEAQAAAAQAATQAATQTTATQATSTTDSTSGNALSTPTLSSVLNEYTMERKLLVQSSSTMVDVDDSIAVDAEINGG